MNDIIKLAVASTNKSAYQRMKQTYAGDEEMQRQLDALIKLQDEIIADIEKTGVANAAVLPND